MDRATQRGRSLRFLRVLAHIRMSKAQLSGHELAGGVGHCYRTPDEAMVC